MINTQAEKTAISSKSVVVSVKSIPGFSSFGLGLVNGFYMRKTKQLVVSCRYFATST